MKFSKFKATISGEDINVIVASTEHAQSTELKPVTITHHILLIDRSGSMYGELNRLLDQVNETIDNISSQDLLSVLWYSGPGQFQTVVKGAKAGSDIKTEINKLRRTVGSTCFSEPLKAANDLVKEFASIVHQTNLLLFTDGQPCVYWSVAEEETRSKAAVAEMAKNGLSSMTCIGYGNYYNRRFLIEVADETDHGQIMHNSRIDEFLDTFRQSVGAASDLVKKRLAISSMQTADYLYLTDKTINLSQEVNEINLDSISTTRNDFYIISPSSLECMVNEEGEDPHHFTSTIKAKTTDDEKQNFFYGYASKLYYYGKRLKALDIIVSNCKDKYLANKMVNAFTNAEVAETQKALDEAVFDKSKRLLEGKCPPGFLPAKDALCVMDVFNKLFDHDGMVYYIPFSNNVEKYKRIGKKVEDKESIFTPSENEVRMPISEFIWASDKSNLSILFSIPGTVKLNAKMVKDANKGATKKLGTTFPAKIYNTHAIIKDGTLNRGQIEFLMDDDTHLKLAAMGVAMTVIPDTSGTNLVRVVVDLSKLPVINQTYIDNSKDMNFIFDIVKANIELQCKQNVLNREIKKVYQADTSLQKTGIFEELTEDQISVLKDHGITDQGVYSGLDNQVNTDNPDSYEIKVLNFGIEGQKSVPTAKQFEDAYKAWQANQTQPSNPLRWVMVQYMDDLQSRFDFSQVDEALRDGLKQEQKAIKNQLSGNRQKLSLIKLAKILNNDFFDDLQKDDKGNLFFEKMNEKLTVSAERKMVNI